MNSVSRFARFVVMGEHLTTNDRDLPTNNHDLPTNDRDLPTNDHDLQTNNRNLQTNIHDLQTNNHDFPKNNRVRWRNWCEPLPPSDRACDRLLACCRQEKISSLLFEKKRLFSFQFFLVLIPFETSLVSTGADGTVIGGNGEDTDQHELDPTGNSVGFSDPYVGGIPDFEVPLFSGESHPSLVNGVQASYTIDGLRVPPSQFGRMFDFAFGGIFGAVERTARLSASPVGYRTETRYLIRTASGPPTLRNSPAERGGPMLPTTADGESEIYGTYTVTSPVYASNWSVSSLLSVLQTGKPATLTDDENNDLDKRIKKLVDEKLSKKNCRDFLIRQLGESGYKKLVETLKNQGLRFSARRSTDITVEEAGLYGVNARRSLTLLSDKNYTDDPIKRREYRQALERLDWSVSKWASRVGIHAVLGTVNGDRVVFYNSFKKITTIVHENLHLSSGLGDVGLAKALGLKDEAGNDYADTFKASAAISRALIASGCTN